MLATVAEMSHLSAGKADAATRTTHKELRDQLTLAFASLRIAREELRKEKERYARTAASYQYFSYLLPSVTINPFCFPARRFLLVPKYGSGVAPSDTPPASGHMSSFLLSAFNVLHGRFPRQPASSRLHA